MSVEHDSDIRSSLSPMGETRELAERSRPREAQDEVKDFLTIINLLKDNNVEEISRRLAILERLLRSAPVLHPVRYDFELIRNLPGNILSGAEDDQPADMREIRLLRLLANQEFYQRSITACEQAISRCSDAEEKKSVRFALFFLKGRDFMLDHVANNPLLDLVLRVSLDQFPEDFQSNYAMFANELSTAHEFDERSPLNELNREILKMESELLQGIFARKIAIPIYFDELISFYLFQKLYNSDPAYTHSLFLQIFRADLDAGLREKLVKRVSEQHENPEPETQRSRDAMLFFLQSGFIRVPFFLSFTVFKNGDYFLRFQEEQRFVKKIMMGADLKGTLAAYSEFYLGKGCRDIYERLWVKSEQFSLL